MRAIRNSCSICMGSLKNPKVISCHHSFCSKCLDDYVRVKLRNGRFDCPLCRTSVELPKGGVSGFETNIYFESDLVDNFESTKLSNEAREKKAREEREKKARFKTPRTILPESQGMEARDKALNEELFTTRKQHEEANANAITKGTKLTQAEMEIQALRNQIADYVAQSQGMEAKVKALNEELFKTRKQHEEANANAITKGTKLTQAEKEIQALRNQIADYVAQRMEARVKALEEGLSSTRNQYQEAKANCTDEWITGWMCTCCQEWIEEEEYGFNCKCGGMYN